MSRRVIGAGRRTIGVAWPLVASLAGVVGFGTLYRGIAGHRLGTVLLGLALALFGLERAGRALAASILLSEARRAARRPAESSSPGGKAPLRRSDDPLT